MQETRIRELAARLHAAEVLDHRLVVVKTEELRAVFDRLTELEERDHAATA